MARTFVRQDTQIRNSDVYDDAISPSEAAFETNPAHIEDDLNNMRSQIHNLLKVQAGNWWDDINIPSAVGDTGTQRGVNDLNSALYSLQRKRVLVKAVSLADVTVATSENWVVLGTGELPPNTTAAVGAVNTLGTVVATHGGTFDSHDLTTISGSTAISPKNFVEVVDGTTRDPILDASGNTIYGLLHGESGLIDGGTITDTTTTRVQVSFVVINGTGDGLVAAPVADIENKVVNLCFTERKAMEGLTEQDFLRGAVTDVPGSATVTRQVAYDNQGTTPVNLTTNATLDLEGAGVTWTVRDDLEADVFSIVEGSTGGTTQFNIHAAVDEYDNDAAVVDFASGATLNSGGSRPITVGVTDGEITTTAGDLMVRASAELLLDDGNQTGSTWAQDGIKLSETTAEWDTFELNFGEVSLLNAINQAFSNDVRTKVQAVLTANVSADSDVNGPTFANNTDVDLAPYDQVTFVDDVEVWVNGILQRNGANAAANEDVYPGTSPAQGDLKFEYALKSTGNADVITVIVNGQ